jgi:hypothetical protein
MDKAYLILKNEGVKPSRYNNINFVSEKKDLIKN